MNLSFVEKGFYADVVGPCSHNHEDSCGDYARRVAAGSLETVADLRAENARLQTRVEEAERNLETHLLGYSPYRAELDRYKALAERREEALEQIKTGRMDIGGKDEAMPRAVMMSVARAAIEEEEPR